MNNDPTLQAILDRRKATQDAATSQDNSKNRDHTNLDKIFTMFALYLDHVVMELQDGKLHTEVTNWPTIQQVIGSLDISSAPSIEHALAALVVATVDNKIELPKVQDIIGTVTVSNFPEDKDIKFPEYPKQIKTDVVSLPKYLGEKLDALKTAINSLPAPVVNVPETLPPIVHMDTAGIITQLEVLESLLATLTDYEAEDEPLDLTPVVQANLAVVSAIEAIKFPIPNFQSSWQHSRQMQSMDADMAYHYATISTPDALDGVTTERAIDYLEVTLGDGVFRQSFTYNTYGEIITKSRWIQQ